MGGDDREDVAGELIAGLEAGAELVERGAFELDLVEARKKLAAFALPDPDRFVLLLVEAAHLLSGCTSLSFTISGRATRAHFEGTSLDADELRGCFHPLPSSASERTSARARRLRARQRLGLALDAALGITGAPIEIRSSTAEGTLRFVLGPGGASHLDTTAETSLTPSLSLAIPAGGLASWVSGRARNQRALLREHAWPATIPLWLDGARIDHGLELPDLVDGVVIHDDDGQPIGRVGWSADRCGSWGSIDFVVNGVMVETVLERSLASGLTAIVDASELGRDLSQSKLRRGAAYDSLVERVVAAQSTLDKPAPNRVSGALVGGKEGESLGAGLLMGGFLGVGVIFTRTLRHHRVLRRGRACAGVIRSVSSTTVGKHGVRQHRLAVQVEPEGAPAYAAEILIFSPDQPTRGERVFLRVDPSDPSLVVLDPVRS